MNFEDCQTLWRSQGSTTTASAADWERLRVCVGHNARRFDRTIFWRDHREIAVAFILAALTGVTAWQHTVDGYVPWGRWASLAITLGVALRFLSARRHAPPPPAEGRPLLEQLDFTLAALRGQVRNLERVPMTYAAPLFIATLCAGFDPLVQRGGLGAIWSGIGLLVIGVAVAVAGFVICLNRLAISRVLEPKVTELQRLRDEIAG